MRGNPMCDWIDQLDVPGRGQTLTITLVPEQVKALKKLLWCCRWIGSFVNTAKDQGQAWCVVRRYPGAPKWSGALGEIVGKCDTPK